MLMDTMPLFGSIVARDSLRAEAETGVARAIAMMNRARALVCADRVHSIPLLNARRAALADYLGRYQRFKHGRIFDPVVQRGPASSRLVASTMKVDCMELGEIFSAYHTRWITLRAPDWPAYRRDMELTVDMLTGHLKAELRAIRQLLAISDLYGD